ncbi:monocarboxylate transporter 9 [Lasius niger]|uniref:Monocarboxylate transporter 9 n=1 Tax=Lasius niger TaxID=67767 RepID=A0A0J7K259_LASNI|nr:monocarboxylate transporter 9 [Lasius niger]
MCVCAFRIGWRFETASRVLSTRSIESVVVTAPFGSALELRKQLPPALAHRDQGNKQRQQHKDQRKQDDESEGDGQEHGRLVGGLGRGANKLSSIAPALVLSCAAHDPALGLAGLDQLLRMP